VFLRKLTATKKGSRVDAMVEYGCEIVLACRKFMFVTMIFLLHGYLLPNNSVVMYKLGLNVEP